MTESENAAARHGTRERVLVVDDELLVGLYIEDALDAIGYDCCAVASNPDEAVRSAEREQPAFALVDISLGGETDGIALATVLRDEFDIQVIFLSGWNDADTRRRAEAAKPAGYLLKPCSEDDLARALHAAKQLRPGR